MKGRKFTNRITAFVMAIGMTLSTLPQPAMTVHAEPGQAETEKEISGLGAGTITGPVKENNNSVWDMVEFGNYPQAQKEWKKQPIKWRILSVDEDGNALLLADRALDCRKYLDGPFAESVTWENSGVRKWLNATGSYENDETAFLNAAFSDKEKADILVSEITTPDNPETGMDGGNDTTDKVFLLSAQDVTNTAYGFEHQIFIVSGTREAEVTDYAQSKGSYRNNNLNPGNGYWWLRSTSISGVPAAFILEHGWGAIDRSFKTIGIDKEDYDDLSVRPALRINLDSQYISDAGTVSSDGTVVEVTDQNYVSDDVYNAPSVDDNGISSWDCVYFGTYYQDAEFEVQPIEWRVLSVSDNDIFLLADKGLDCKPFNAKFESVTWDNCSLREWLNDDFIKAAFTDEESSAILLSDIENPDNPDYSGVGCDNTQDKVYPMSIEEIYYTECGFEISYYNAHKSREAKMTDYAKIRGASYEKSGNYAGNGSWWLRTSGYENIEAVFVSIYGSANEAGYTVNREDISVRPVLHINRNSLIAVSKISDKAAGVGAKYKLTVADEKLNITLGKVTMAGNVVSVPYNITGGAEYATQISAIVTDGTWTDKGWSKDAALKQYKKIADVNGTSGTCSFSLAGNISGELGKDYHIYIIAEAVNAEGETDYASVPVEAGGNSIPAVTAPVAKTGLIASDTAQALVTAGKANYGEMFYALGTDDKTAPTDGWSKEVPTAKDAGTYYVWYKVVGDADHEDTVPACVKVTIAEKEQPKEDDKPEEVITDPVNEKQEKVSEPVKETINDVPISANLAVSYPKAVEWTGKKITKAQLEALLAEGEVLTKLNISGLEEALKGKMKEGTDISKLFSYNLTISKDKDAGATGYFTVKVKLNSKAVKKAKIKGADKKALSQLVKDLNEKLKDTRFEYKIAALNLAEAESVSIKAKLKNGTLQLDEQGGLKGLKSVKVKIKIKGVKKAKTFTYSAKKAAKVFTIKITDAAAKTAELTALEGTGFTGTKSGISITK